MKGSKNGVATKIRNIEPRATFIHCNGHLLNLAVKDCIKGTKNVPGSRVLSDALDYAYEIIKLIKKSPRREAIFETFKNQIVENSAPKIRTLCPTRWTVKAEAFKSDGKP